MKTLTKRVIGSTVVVGVLAGLAVVGTAGVADAALPSATANVYSWSGQSTYTVQAAKPQLPIGTKLISSALTVEQNGKVVATGTSAVLKPGTYTLTTVTTVSGSYYADKVVSVPLKGVDCQVVRTWTNATMDIACTVPAMMPIPGQGWSGFKSDDTRTLFLTVKNPDGLKVGAGFVSPTTANTEYVTTAYRSSVYSIGELPLALRSHSQIVDQRVLTVKYVKETPHIITDAMRKKVTLSSSKATADKQFHQVGAFAGKSGKFTTYKWKEFTINAKTGHWQVVHTTQITYLNGKAIAIARGQGL